MSLITVRSGIVPDDLLLAVLDDINARGWSYGWRSNTKLPMTHWHIGIADNGRLERDPVELQGPYKAVFDALQPLVLPEHPVPMRAYVNGHSYGCEGYPHTDSTHAEDRTLVVYLNREWSRNWGGETAFYQGDDIIGSVSPKWGRAVSFPGTLWHAARSVTRICPDLRMTLVYKARAVSHET
jgi:SM-20-related protein